MKIKEVIERLIAVHAPLDRPEHTCDTVKFGDVERECTGVGVTCFASMDVIRRAKEKGLNLLIAHECVFYSHDENTEDLKDDPVYLEKCAALADAGVTIWRYHDYAHGPGAQVHTQTDYIYYGIARELGWEGYARGEETKPLWFQIPRTTVSALARELAEKLGLTGVRVVGDLDAPVSTVFLCEHVFGNSWDGKAIAKAARADVVIPLEAVDWTLSAYIRDAAQQGRGKAMIEPGHFNLEELGMKHMVRWLPDVIGGEVPVEYLQSGDAFRYILR